MKPVVILIFAAFTVGWPLRWGFIGTPIWAPVMWAFAYAGSSVFLMKWRSAGSGPAKSFLIAALCSLAAFLGFYGLGYLVRAW